MIYRPQQNQGRGKSSNGRPRAGTEYDDDPSGYWGRKQVPNSNRVCGDADSPIAPPDRDAESSNYSYGQKGYERSKTDKGQDLWSDEAWKDKD